MGFKRIKSSDLSMSPYTANKQYDVTYNSFTFEGIKIYTGQKVTGSFNASTDPITTDNVYRRSVYDSINHKFYQNFSGSFIDTRETLRTNYYESASMYRPSGSYYNYSDIRATGSFPTNTGSTIKVIEIPTNICGEGISKKTIVLNSVSYNIVDDGFGNLINTNNANELVGNVFYGQGVIVITNQAYQSYFDFTEPTTTTTTSTTTTTTTPPTTTTTSTTSTTTTAAPTTTTSTTTSTTTAAPTTTTSTTTSTTTPPPTTTTTTSTTTTTTTAVGGLTIANNVSVFGATIDAVRPSSDYIVTSGAFPLNKGELVKAIISNTTTSFSVDYTDGSTISLYKNSVLQQSFFVVTGEPTTSTFSPISYVSTDILLIELT